MLHKVRRLRSSSITKIEHVRREDFDKKSPRVHHATRPLNRTEGTSFPETAFFFCRDTDRNHWTCFGSRSKEVRYSTSKRLVLSIERREVGTRTHPTLFFSKAAEAKTMTSSAAIDFDTFYEIGWGCHFEWHGGVSATVSTAVSGGCCGWRQVSMTSQRFANGSTDFCKSQISLAGVRLSGICFLDSEGSLVVKRWVRSQPFASGGVPHL